MKACLTALLLIFLKSFATQPSGALSGRVTASGTMLPVPGAFVVVEGLDAGDITGPEGEFSIRGLEPGAYVLRITSVGFHPEAVTDVIIRPDRITSLSVELVYSVVDAGVILVTPDYFIEEPGEPVGRIGFSGEQIRRSPGSAGDVSRVIAALPSVARTDDQYNGMAVRGGNPSENGIYLDGMRIPNINHFPRQGTSGGGLGLINTDLIREVRFSAGGFSPEFGNRLSSIMEIETRDGNRSEFDGQLDISMSGFGAVLEGPVGEKGSWLACARRSYLDLLVDIADIDALPRYSDYHGKLVYDLSASHRLSFSLLGADDYVDYTHSQAWEDGNDNFGITESRNTTAGVGWRWIWPRGGFSNTVLSWNGIKYGGDYRYTLTGDLQALQNSTENTVTLRNANKWQADPGLELEFGAEGSLSIDLFDNFYAADTNYSGDPIPELAVFGRNEDFTAGCFASAGVKPLQNLVVNLGARLDGTRQGNRAVLSPRFSAELGTSPVTWISAAVGIYRQELPGELTARDPSFSSLEVPSSLHAVLGFRHLLEPDTRIQVECYLKRGKGFPFDPSQPGYFVLDGVSSEQDLYSFENLESGGESRAYGLEATLQKQLVSGLYGLAAGSLYSSKYRNPGEENWRRRIFDNRWTAALEGGYRFDSGWEISGRWLLAGGRPYTPLDLEASQELNRTVLDSTRINAVTYPYYSSLNLRTERRFNFSGSSLVCYLSVWNVLNRRNVTATYWNRIENREDFIYQWATMPVFGVEYEF